MGREDTVSIPDLELIFIYPKEGWGQQFSPCG